MRAATVATLVVMLAAAAPAARAEEPRPAARVAVVAVLLDVDPTELTASIVSDRISKAMFMRTSLSLISEEDLFVAGGHRQQILDCGSDVACIADALRAIRADLGLIVLVNYGVDPPIVDLRLVETQGAQILAKSAAPLGAPDRASPGDVGKAIELRAAKLLDEAGHPQRARLVVQVEPARPEMIIAVEGGEHHAGADATFDLEPGEVIVRASAPGLEAKSERVNVVRGEVKRVSIALEEQSSLTTSSWIWIGAAAAVVIAGTAVAIVALGSEDCFCLVRDGVECTSCAK